MTESRVRRTIDYGRLGEATSHPGADPRAWVLYARVDDDDDAITFDDAVDGDGLGWLVDVTFQGGALDQEGPIPCLVASSFSRADNARLEPVTRGCLVTVLLVEGDPNGAPTIIGSVPTGDCKVPATVNGDDIDEAFALVNHILVTPHSVDEQIGGTLRRVASGDLTLRTESVGLVEAEDDLTLRTNADAVLEADGDVRVEAKGSKAQVLSALVELADDGASQSFVQGNNQQEALDSFLTDLNTWAGDVSTAIIGAGGSPPSSQGTFLAAIQTLQQKLEQALSSKIKGE